MTHSVEYFSNSTFNDAVVLERMQHFNRMLAEELPDDPPLVAEDAIRRMYNLPSISRMHVWVVRHAGRVAAQATLNWAELPSNRRQAGLHITVEPELRRRGFGRKLLHLTLDRARSAKRSLLLAGSSDRIKASAHFLEMSGFEPGLETHVNQLVLSNLDRKMIADWLAAGSARARDYEIELWDGPVPDDRLEAFAELSNVMNTAPRGSLDIEDIEVTPQMIREWQKSLFANGSRLLTACARHVPTGELAGFTEIFWSPKRAVIAFQRGTGVRTTHRNLGLGRWLKAANIEELLRKNPSARFVRTGNADSNAPMLRINRQMGFQPFIAQVEWQGHALRIAEKLKQAGG
jgi:mycothiol synthase